MLSFRRTHYETGNLRGKSYGLMYVVLHLLLSAVPKSGATAELASVDNSVQTKQAEGTPNVTVEAGPVPRGPIDPARLQNLMEA
jgi:hypothetical protein